MIYTIFILSVINTFMLSFFFIGVLVSVNDDRKKAKLKEKERE